MDFLPYLQSSRKDYLRISIRPLLLQHSVRLTDGPTSKKYWRDMIGEPMEITYIPHILSGRIIQLLIYYLETAKFFFNP